MKVLHTTAIVLATALVAGCGASTSSSSVSPPPVTTTASSSDSASSMSCTDFDMTAAHLLTYVHYVSLNVGTENSSAGYFSQMKDAVAALDANTAACAPKAAAAVAALGPATSALEAAYKSGKDAAAVAADKAALAAFLVVGKAAWTAMGKDPTIWDTELKYSV